MKYRKLPKEMLLVIFGWRKVRVSSRLVLLDDNATDFGCNRPQLQHE